MTDLPLTSDAIVDTYGFLSSILTGIAQSVWVVDPVGDIRFANPAAAAALGYDDPAELHGKPSHETIHYKHPDGSHYPVEECPMLRPRRTSETIHSDKDWFVRRDGTMVPVEYWSAPMTTRARARSARWRTAAIPQHRPLSTASPKRMDRRT
jgi:PAS domain S-box-containing protein